jgi:hypothetical protein
VSQTATTPNKKVLRPLYSQILNDLNLLNLRKAYSEMLPFDSSEDAEEHKKIHKVIEE